MTAATEGSATWSSSRDGGHADFEMHGLPSALREAPHDDLISFHSTSSKQEDSPGPPLCQLYVHPLPRYLWDGRPERHSMGHRGEPSWIRLIWDFLFTRWRSRRRSVKTLREEDDNVRKEYQRLREIEKMRKEQINGGFGPPQYEESERGKVQQPSRTVVRQQDFAESRNGSVG
jgi:hypothetical protein